MAATVPDWLRKRGGSLCDGSDGCSRYVVVDGEPHYRLKPIPVAGKFGCEVEQTINSRRLDSKSTYASADAALQGGLEELRLKLGW